MEGEQREETQAFEAKGKVHRQEKLKVVPVPCHIGAKEVPEEAHEVAELKEANDCVEDALFLPELALVRMPVLDQSNLPH